MTNGDAVNSSQSSDMGKSINDRSRQTTKTAHVFCNGDLKDPDRARAAVAYSELVIAANGGAKHLAAVGLKPDAIIGDLDSLGTAAKWAEEAIVRISHPSDKDKSDAELAVEYALAEGCQKVTLMAAVGKRLDHTVGNIALVAKYPGRVAILDGNFTLVAVNKSEKFVLHGSIGRTVSLIPYGPGQIRARTRGLKYSLQNDPLSFATHGLSNEQSEAEACVCVSRGILLVCFENKDDGLNP